MLSLASNRRLGKGILELGDIRLVLSPPVLLACLVFESKM